MAIKHTVHINGRIVSIEDNDYIVSENENVDTLSATFSTHWDNLDLITVTFENNGYVSKSTYSNEMTIPKEIIAVPGELLMTFVGSKVDDDVVSKIITKKMIIGIPVVQAGRHN